MKLSILTGALVALLTGIAIAAQSTLTSRVGSLIGDIRTGILTNTMGGIAAGSLVLLWLLREGPETWKVSSSCSWYYSNFWYPWNLDHYRDFFFSPTGRCSSRVGQCNFGTISVINDYRFNRSGWG